MHHPVCPHGLLWDKIAFTLNAELNPICHLLTLLGAHHILHLSRIRVNIPYETLLVLCREQQVNVVKRNALGFTSALLELIST
jgi:hypothetical protein